MIFVDNWVGRYLGRQFSKGCEGGNGTAVASRCLRPRPGRRQVGHAGEALQVVVDGGCGGRRVAHDGDEVREGEGEYLCTIGRKYFKYGHVVDLYVGT